ncbi:MAG: beta-hemolysin [Linnemannia elongata]|nr:MAG: beta-hemolysin [Linnemannia elongata]
MQSEDELSFAKCAKSEVVRVRQEALKELHSFIAKQNIPANEPVIMVGGFNISKDTDEFQLMLASLDASLPASYEGHQWTWDTKANEIARRLYPDGQSKYTDFALTDKRHLTPKTSVQTCLQEKFDVEYSDYYPAIRLHSGDIHIVVPPLISITEFSFSRPVS